MCNFCNHSKVLVVEPTSMKYYSDEYYIERVRKGDLGSYRFLVDKHKSAAFSVALRIVKNREDAEEIAQDAFLKAFRALGSFQGNAKFTTWLYRIVFTTSVSKLRARKPEMAVGDKEYIMESAIEEHPGQIDFLKPQEQKRYLVEAIKVLDEIDSALISMYYFEEMSVEEMSQATGLSESNVKVRLFRARKQLYDELNVRLRKEADTLI